MKTESTKWFEVLGLLLESEIVPNAIHRVLLYGPPGTGKSSAPWRARQGEGVTRVTLTPAMPVEELTGCWQLRATDGGTDTVWQDGPAIVAMRTGAILVLDEVDRRSPDVEPLLHQLLDDRAMLRVTLPTGEVVEAADGFAVFATTNATPDDLPAALKDRFGISLLCDLPAPGILDAVPEGLRNMTTAHMEEQGRSAAEYCPTPTARTALAWVRLTAALDDCSSFDGDAQEYAARLIYGKRADDVLSVIGTASVSA